jgi:hypothetical protein
MVPDKFIYVTEYNYSSTTIVYPEYVINYSIWCHNRGLNALMGDYHVEWISYKRAKADRDWFGGAGSLWGYGVWCQTGTNAP